MTREKEVAPTGKMGANHNSKADSLNGALSAAERKRDYMKAYRQRPEVKERERARKPALEYKARQAEYMRDYNAWNRVRLTGYEQTRRAAVRQRELIAKGDFGEVPRYSDSSIFQCGVRP